MKTPQPVSKDVICSECGLDWETHTKVTEIKGVPVKGPPTLETCVALLRMELGLLRRRRPVMAGTTVTPGTWTQIGPQTIN